MIINGALLLLLRSVSMALLVMVEGQWVLVYLLSDMGMYFMYKILRRDLWHWVPLEGAASVLESVLERLVVKVLVDFTGVIQFRAPAEMGGCFWAFDMVRAHSRASEASAKELLPLTSPAAVGLGRSPPDNPITCPLSPQMAPFLPPSPRLPPSPSTLPFLSLPLM
jgi:hypothetical protein